MSSGKTRMSKKEDCPRSLFAEDLPGQNRSFATAKSTARPSRYQNRWPRM